MTLNDVHYCHKFHSLRSQAFFCDVIILWFIIIIAQANEQDFPVKDSFMHMETTA